VYVVLDQWDREFGGVDPDLLDRAAGTYQVRSFDSIEELSAIAVDLAARGVTVRRVASFAEFSQYGAGLLAELTGAGDPSLRLAVLSRDKRAMKARLRAFGVPCANHMSVPSPDSLPDVAEVACTLGFPVVVKPVSGMGATSTVRVDRAEDLAATIQRLEFPPLLSTHQLTIEEYVNGEEFHADGVWADGEPWHFTVGRYARPRLAASKGEETSYLVNPDDDAALISAAEKLHRAVNDALGFRSGASHFEFFRRPDGELVASEVATRFGGGPLLDMVLGRDNVDLRGLWAHQVAGLPRPQAPATGGRWSHVAGINIPPRGGGAVTAVPSEADLEADPHVLAHHGSCRLGEVPSSPWTLMLVIGAGSAGELVDVVAAARSRYVIETEGAGVADTRT
jgi:biotin carboxylase